MIVVLTCSLGLPPHIDSYVYDKGGKVKETLIG
jgi:hypothetical protein